MKSKLIVKLFSIFMSLTAALSVSAENSLLSLSVPEFFDIQVDNDSQSGIAAKLVDGTLTIRNDLNATFSVRTNVDGSLYLHAIAGSDTSSGYALWFSDSNSHLSFANTKESHVPDGIAVRSTLADSGNLNPDDNPEVISFPVTITPTNCTLVKNDITKGATVNIERGENAKISLKIENGTASIAGTLDGNDTAGTYITTLYLTSTVPSGGS